MLRRSLSVTVGLALLMLAGCASTASENPDIRPTRAAEFTPCPTLQLSEVPAGFTPRERQLEALSDNHMGQVTTYVDGRRSIKVYSGPDLYDDLEDLDLTAERVRTDRFDFAMSSTPLQPELLIAVMDDKDFRPPCDNLGVLARHVDRKLMLKILDDLEVRAVR